MYKFFKVFSNGKEKYCDTFRSTLDPNYHAYINWCNENGIGWKLVGSDGKVKFQSEEASIDPLVGYFQRNKEKNDLWQ